MRRMLTRTGALVLAGLILLVGRAPAQFQVNPNILTTQPAASSYGVARPVAVPTPVYTPVPAYGGYGGGWNYYGMTPAYGALTGAANLTNANAQYQVTIQQARQMNEQTKRDMLDTRKAVIQQMQWEYENTPSLETQRERERERAVRRSLNDPPLSEISAGDALNTLLEQARRNIIAQVPGPLVPLDPEVLKHINVTTGTTTGGSQVTRATDDLKWPLPLQAPQYKDLRDIISATMGMAATEARSGGIQFETDKKLNDAIKDLDKEINDAVAVLTPTEFVQARRFVTQLKDSRKTLGDGSATGYLTGKFSARGNNVGELVQNMNASGLRFAPALPGDEVYYRVLHGSMAAFVGSQAMLTAQGGRPAPPPTMP